MERRYQVLALSGGGYRGLFSATLLEKLEEASGEPLRNRFDLIIGTSIGGLLACGLACGLPAGEIRAAMERHGGAIFDRRPRICGRRFWPPLPRVGILASRYSQDGLREAAASVLGVHAGTSLASVSAPLMAVAVSRQNARPIVFRSAGISDRPSRASLLDAVLATSAAPTYFPEHLVEGETLIDGGIVANAPDLIGLAEIMARYGARPDTVEMLSVGTAGGGHADVPRRPRGHGALRWMLPGRLFGRALFAVTISAQEAMALEITQRLLRDRHVRLDRHPSAEQQVHLGLDRASPRATAVLGDLARQAWRELENSRDRTTVEGMLRHRASWATPRGIL
ncbi:CBASS cGAMP-activated phospholipase [Siccirubricoccus phaeus]|uniref:CBASS cGAMP-activated phospholipase n=1 Tax=Siccirubricoccus phaeus TaxID=2595053 RepID=UPI00165C9F0B|nr:CBASS cGAMP-activated phospholipase [Siccirubricoccus phaeus]